MTGSRRCDLALDVLEKIATDETAPAIARVKAAEVLLAAARTEAVPESERIAFRFSLGDHGDDESLEG